VNHHKEQKTMPATKATKPADVAPTDFRSAITADAAKRWRTWADTLSGGGDPPGVRELFEAAAILGIDDPADAIRADAEALTEYRKAEANVDLCRATAAEKIKQWGSIEELQHEIFTTEALLAELRATLADVQHECNSYHWLAARHRIASRNPRVFPSYMNGN
jgi:hypothetical protein